MRGLGSAPFTDFQRLGQPGMQSAVGARLPSRVREALCSSQAARSLAHSCSETAGGRAGPLDPQSLLLLWPSGSPFLQLGRAGGCPWGPPPVCVEAPRQAAEPVKCGLCALAPEAAAAPGCPLGLGRQLPGGGQALSEDTGPAPALLPQSQRLGSPLKRDFSPSPLAPSVRGVKQPEGRACHHPGPLCRSDPGLCLRPSFWAAREACPGLGGNPLLGICGTPVRRPQRP